MMSLISKGVFSGVPDDLKSLISLSEKDGEGVEQNDPVEPAMGVAKFFPRDCLSGVTKNSFVLLLKKFLLRNSPQGLSIVSSFELNVTVVSWKLAELFDG